MQSEDAIESAKKPNYGKADPKAILASQELRSTA